MNRSRGLSMSHCGCGSVIWACLFGAKSLVWGLFSFPDSLLLLQDLAIIPREYVQRSYRNIIYLKDGLDWVGLYSSKMFVFYLCAFLNILIKSNGVLERIGRLLLKKQKLFFQVMMMSLVKFTPCVQCAGSACGNMREVCLGVWLALLTCLVWSDWLCAWTK